MGVSDHLCGQGRREPLLADQIPGAPLHPRWDGAGARRRATTGHTASPRCDHRLRDPYRLRPGLDIAVGGAGRLALAPGRSRPASRANPRPREARPLATAGRPSMIDQVAKQTTYLADSQQ
jgi:hypothetical protein